MAQCEDFPACGHESGCCPDYSLGKQLNMKCVCGATVPLGGSSLCPSCLNEQPRQHLSAHMLRDDVDECDFCTGEVACHECPARRP